MPDLSRAEKVVMAGLGAGDDLELALQLKKKYGGRVLAPPMGPRFLEAIH